MIAWRRRAVLAMATRGAAVLASSVAATSCRSGPRARATPEPVHASTSAKPVVAAVASTASDFAVLHGACDGITGPDPTEWAEHRARVHTAMRAAGIDALVVEPGAGMQYLTGIAWGRSERPFVVVIRATDKPVILCPAFEQRTATERANGLDLVLWREHEDPFAALATIVRAEGGTRSRVAIEPSTRRFLATGLARALPRASVVERDVLGEARMRKSAAELARLRRANEATKRALAEVGARIRVGTEQRQIAEWTEQALLAAGLVDPWVLALVGPNASFPHGTAQQREVESGDVVLIDTGASLQGYRSDITRTFVVGDPSDEVARAWSTVAKAQRAAFAAIRPGARCGEVDAAARNVMADAGYDRADRDFTHRLGHGIGLEVHEPPYLVGGSDVVLATGMTMSNEPGLYVPGAFGIRLEDIVAVTDDGAEVFGPWPDAVQPLRDGSVAAQLGGLPRERC